MPWHFGPAKTCAVSSICTKMCVWDKILWRRSLTRHDEAPQSTMTCKCFQILRSMYQSIKHLRIECFMVLFLCSSYYHNIKYMRVECFVVPCLCNRYQSTNNMSNECSLLQYKKVFEFSILRSHATVIFTTVPQNCALSASLEKIE